MNIDGEERIGAPRDVVWQALNDAEFLRQCIPGCQSLEWISPSQLAAIIKVKLGPLSASFSGIVTLSDIHAPDSYIISAEGKGGIAGFAKGAARVTLVDEGPETLLRYSAEAQVGGKLAKLGSRFIGSSTQKLATQFFEGFNAAVMARTGRS